MKLEMSNFKIDPTGKVIRDKAGAYTNIEANLRLYIGERLFLDFQDACIVELAGMLHKWLSSGDALLTDFQYESMDEEEKDILCFVVNGNEVKVYSIWQKFSVTEPLEMTAVIIELERFIKDVIDRCRHELAVDVSGWVLG